MVSGHQVLVRTGHGELLVLHLGLGHVVIARVKVLLLQDTREEEEILFSTNQGCQMSIKSIFF